MGSYTDRLGNRRVSRPVVPPRRSCGVCGRWWYETEGAARAAAQMFSGRTDRRAVYEAHGGWHFRRPFSPEVKAARRQAARG